MSPKSRIHDFIDAVEKNLPPLFRLIVIGDYYVYPEVIEEIHDATTFPTHQEVEGIRKTLKDLTQSTVVNDFIVFEAHADDSIVDIVSFALFVDDTYFVLSECDMEEVDDKTMESSSKTSETSCRGLFLTISHSKPSKGDSLGFTRRTSKKGP